MYYEKVDVLIDGNNVILYMDKFVEVYRYKSSLKEIKRIGTYEERNPIYQYYQRIREEYLTGESLKINRR